MPVKLVSASLPSDPSQSGNVKSPLGMLVGGNAIDLAVAALLAILIVNRYSPPFLNADVILNSIMSLQNLTLFYWGQNRLINIIPLLAYPIREPTANLLFCIYLSTLSFLYLFWIISIYAAKIYSGIDSKLIGRTTFLILVVIFLISVRPQNIFDIVVGHPEYTIALSLFSNLIISSLIIKNKTTQFIIMLIICIISTGINNAILVPECIFVIFWFCKSRIICSQKIIFLVLSIVSFAFWFFVSKSYPSFPVSYYGLSLSLNGDAEAAVVRNIADIFRYSITLCLVVSILLIGLYNVFRRRGEKYFLSRERQAQLAMLFFDIVWLCVFSNITWIRINAYNFRYFIPVIFAGFVILAIEIQAIIIFFVKKYGHFPWIILSIGLVVNLMTPWVSPHNYMIFRQLPISSLPGVVGYAGDYWAAWPAVMRDLMNHQNSFGLSNRGDGNIKNVVRFYQQSGLDHRSFKIACLNAPVADCHAQIAYFFGDEVPTDLDFVSESVTLINVLR